MYLILIFEILIVTCLVGYLIQSYCSKDVSIYVKGMALVSWLINFLLILFLPFDIYITYRDQSVGDISNDYLSLAETYQILYWTNFILCWTVIPIMQEYEESVELEKQAKLKKALKNNMKFYIIISVVGIVFVLAIFYTGQTEQCGLGTFLKSMANSFGVALIILLLGYGLVIIPKAQMRTSQLDVQLKYLYFRTASINGEKDDAHHKLMETSMKVLKIKDYRFDNDDMMYYLNKCLNKIPRNMHKILTKEEEKRKSQILMAITGAIFKNKAPESVEEMMSLYQEIRKNSLEYKRIKAQWKENCKSAYEMEDIIKAINSQDKKIQFSFKKAREGKLAQQLDLLEWYWLCVIKPQLKIIISLIFGILSILVLISEVTIFMGTQITIFGLPLRYVNGLLSISFFSFIPLLYIAFCVYYGLFRIRIQGFYGLYGDHQTDAPSLMFATINFSRVGAPLCQNFLNMIKLKQETAFRYAMGNIELLPIFGISITALMPCLLVVLCLINYFDLFDRTLQLIGMKKFIFNNTFSDRLIYEGRDTLKINRQYFERKMKPEGWSDSSEPLDIELQSKLIS
ncbi:unnamed protein product [Paramecium sonneborni]|uniref:LMBR1 domain-containing protein 2 n=1 Tax=Paramecium sonneborni TaxID=65129 RepID=A0A8S1KBG7_9CILI|nr:unnamed protein product [Paramecium sonneborni]